MCEANTLKTMESMQNVLIIDVCRFYVIVKYTSTWINIQV